ncbi:MAG: DUF1080 domain-containing protein [Pirellula sp.]|jgi:hypothetical protein|nr:DUF1080 domain-containing protein [Pirellula sp.]
MQRREFVRHSVIVPAALCLGFSSPSHLFAGDTFTSAESAGITYDLQGEYLGVIDAWGGTWGAQVIARSMDDLEVHLLQGGLPGDGFKDQEPTKQCSSKIATDLARGNGDGYTVEIRNGSLTVYDADSKKLGTLSKLMRESKTLGMEPPKDATVLFDGSNADHFQNGKLIEDRYLGVGCTSRETFQDHRLHIEFRTPFQPSDAGQGRGNSGVYVQGRYELQVLDSFGLKGENNECGGIYQIAKPRLNMCYPPLSWQTYDIDFTAPRFDSEGKKTQNARMTIRHNGVLIHDDLELPRGTPGGVSDESKEAGPLHLQDHGNPVAFKNIWVVAAPKPAENNRKGPNFYEFNAIE